MTLKIRLRHWNNLADAAQMLSANPIYLMLPSMALSATVIGLICKHFKPELGPLWSFLLFFIGTFIATPIIAYYLINPLGGMWIMRKIESDYGPKTRSRVWERVVSESEFEADELNIHRIAWECGESSTSPN